MRPKIAAALSLLLVVAASALPAAASADLPKRPSCADVSPALLKSTFGFSFSIHAISKEHQSKKLQHLDCDYRGAAGDLSLVYKRYSSDKAARADFSSVRKSLIRRGKAEAADSFVQLLPLSKLRGVGDMAFRSDDGTVLQFVDGVDSVTIENGFPLDTPIRIIRGMVALAKYVDRHG
jgi:hypothetical protein